MFDYYDHFKINYKAGHEEIKGALDLAYQNLQRKGGSQDEYRILREAQDALLSPMSRAEYDKKLGIKFTELAKDTGGGSFDRKPVIILVALVSVIIALAVFYLPGKIQGPSQPIINPGVYLVSTSTGENSAVLRSFDPDHLFPDKGEQRGYEITVLDSNEIRWITEEELLADYTKGAYAPRDLTGGSDR